MMDAIVAPATASGRSALGIVRVAGPGTRDVARSLLGTEPLEHRRAALRTLRAGDRTVDHVVALFWEAPETPIGDDLLEITAHGSPEILAEIVEAAVFAGARPAVPGEFTRRAFTNGKIDLAQAEAVEALISARGRRARQAAFDRLDGHFTRVVTAARAPILDLLCGLEARLDHPDEDIPPLSAARISDSLRRLLVPLDRLIEAHRRGRGPREGVRVCLAGRPNAGKSSLLNALLGRDRAIVSAAPGTTRDTIEEHATLDGMPVVLVDTAGLRADAPDPNEREGIRRAEQALNSCDVAVLVVDATLLDPSSLDALVAREDRNRRPVLVAYNKADLLHDRTTLSGGIATSATTGEGLNELSQAVARAARSAQSDEGESMMIGARDRGLVASARDELLAAQDDVIAHPQRWEDRVAARLRHAHAQLGVVLGENVPDEVLHAVFSRFCVGK